MVKLNKIIIFAALIIVILSFDAVCAHDNSTSDIIEEQYLDDLNIVSEVNDTENMQIKNIVEDNLTISDEEQFGEIGDVIIEVNNVFKGQNTTVYVIAPEAVGNVDITVGEKIYMPNFINGVAMQTISEYDVGINNITIKYGDVLKEASFKVFDGVVTFETFYDYFEKVKSNELRLRSFIPNGVTLDFRGNFYFKPGISYIVIDRPINLISTTKNASIDILQVVLQEGAEKSNVSNIEFKKNLLVNSYNCILNNLTIYSLNPNAHNLTIVDSIIINKIDKFYNHNNIIIINSTLKNGLIWDASYAWQPAYNLIIINSTITGKLDIRNAKDCLFDNNNIIGEVFLNSYNAIFKNNIVYAPNSTYAVRISNSAVLFNNTVINNVIYSNKYSGNDAVYDNKRFYNLIENNTPTQIAINIEVNQNIVYGENVVLVVNISANGNVIVDVDGQKYTLKLVNGSATQIIDKYTVGINNISVVYDDNDIYAINYTSFNVNKVSYCPITIIYNNFTEGKISNVDVILPDDAEGILTLTLSNDILSIIIKQKANGTNNVIKIPALFGGNYKMIANFSSFKYVTNSSTHNISVVHIPVYELIATNVVMDYKDGSRYNVLVIKDGVAVGAREIVNIVFNGKTVKVKTDERGYATLKLDAAPKTYTIKASYKGITKSSKVTIKNVLKASNISKKKAKTIKFSATLKNSKGKPITGKKITFKLKGKTYTAKTNKKGVATISIKNLKVGKYTITSKYELCTVKKTITVKK